MSNETSLNDASSRDWLDRLLAAHAVEVERRSLIVRVDLDASWRPRLDAELEEAMRLLLRLIFSTVPDGCAVDLAGVRSVAQVSPLSAGEWTARWQVTGPVEDPSATTPTPLHPRPGDAQLHLQGTLASQVCAAFEPSAWSFELSSVFAGRELLARAVHR